MAAVHTLDGVNCDAADGSYRLVAGTDPWSKIPDVSYSDFGVTGRFGNVSTRDPSTGSGAYVLTWFCTATNYETVDQVRDVLLGLVSPATSHTLTRTFNGQTRVATVQTRGTSVKQIGETLQITATFEVPGVFWRDQNPLTATVSGTTSVASTALAGGSAPIFDPVLTMSGGTRITDNVSGSWVELGSGAASSTVDVAALTARAGSTNNDGLLNFSGKPFRVSNNGSLTVSTGSVTISARRAWW